MLESKTKIERHTYEKKVKVLRGKPIIKESMIPPSPFSERFNEFGRFEIFLNNSELENEVEQFSQKEAIIIELYGPVAGIFNIDEMENVIREFRDTILETFTSNTFTNDDDIVDVVDFIEEILKRKGYGYKLYVNCIGKLFPDIINSIPKTQFYYNLTCSYKMKDLVPYTYLAEKVKTRRNFFIETNKVYNGRFLDDNPDMIYLNIWNVNDGGKDTQYKKVLRPANEEFDIISKYLEDSSFKKIDKNY
ncbi:hypothetical protein [Lacrimispora amygdalina]|uniref:hypothetical protein n=1 Tax=Lacrimispora amygdalina TaxID=253257 RepID=UPI000BE345A8|nr:hypothetical protein [Lacrimispora amygdalina]